MSSRNEEKRIDQLEEHVRAIKRKQEMMLDMIYQLESQVTFLMPHTTPSTPDTALVYPSSPPPSGAASPDEDEKR